LKKLTLVELPIARRSPKLKFGRHAVSTAQASSGCYLEIECAEINNNQAPGGLAARYGAY